MAWYAVPGRLDPAELPPRPKVLVMPCSPPPDPPFARGGKGSLAPSFDHAQQKHAARNRPAGTFNAIFSSAQPNRRAQDRWARPACTKGFMHPLPVGRFSTFPVWLLITTPSVDRLGLSVETRHTHRPTFVSCYRGMTD